MSQITEATGLATMIAHLIGLEAKASKMLPKKVSEIAKMIKENQGFVVYHQDEFASFAGFKAWPHCLEVNGLITVPRFRHQGFGIAALEKAILGAQHYIRTNYWNREINTIVALANPDSAKLLHKLGFRHTIKTPVHAELWDDCPDCCEWHRWPNCHCQFMVLDGKLITCKNGRNFATINLASGDQTDLEKTAEFYCQVWREPPWSEDFWQPEKVAAEFVETMKVPGSGFRIAVQDESVIGLSIAYPISLSEIESRADGLEELIPSDYLPIYIAELAVSGSYRHLGIGHALTENLIESIGSSNKTFLLRTHKDAIAARRLYKKIGFKDSGLPDREHPERTYWIRTPDEELMHYCGR